MLGRDSRLERMPRIVLLVHEKALDHGDVTTHLWDDGACRAIPVSNIKVSITMSGTNGGRGRRSMFKSLKYPFLKATEFLRHSFLKLPKPAKALRGSEHLRVLAIESLE